MPEGSPNKNTVRVERYQKKAGYIAKTYKLKVDTVTLFAESCRKAGVSQAYQLSRMMQEFIRSVEQKDAHEQHYPNKSE